MELLFYIFVIGLIVFLSLGLYLPSLMSVDEADIGENISNLKNVKWFQDLLNDKEFKQLIVHDHDVRKIIGKFNSNKIGKKSSQNRYRKKLQHVLQEKANRLA